MAKTSYKSRTAIFNELACQLIKDPDRCSTSPILDNWHNWAPGRSAHRIGATKHPRSIAEEGLFCAKGRQLVAEHGRTMQNPRENGAYQMAIVAVVISSLWHDILSEAAVEVIGGTDATVAPDIVE